MGNIIRRRNFVKQILSSGSVEIMAPAEKHKPANHFNQSLQVTQAQASAELYTGSWTEKEMVHLLRRVVFGASRRDVNHIMGMSMSAAVDFLIDNPVQPSTTPVNVYSPGVDGAGVPFGSSWVTFLGKDPGDGNLNNKRTWYSFKPWWIGQMINQRTHILEKMTLFWSNHFGTNTVTNNRPQAIYQFHNLFRISGLGNFRTLIKQVTLSPHMLYFLGGSGNIKGAPNENYAREFQELFTVGKGPYSGYTEDDVKAAAKVLTGWQVVQSPATGNYSASFDPFLHDTSNKQFSSFYKNQVIAGQTGAAGANEVDILLDMVLATTECAKYLVRCLYRWFVNSLISADVDTNFIAPLATIFRNSNYDIPTVLKAMFKSQHFYEYVIYGSIIKSPIDLYVGMIREFNITLASSPVATMYDHWKNMSDKCAAEGQNIGDPPNVGGWSAYYESPSFYELWMSSFSIQLKARNIKAFSNSGVNIGQVLLTIDSVAFNNQFPDAGDPDAVLRNFILYLLPLDNFTAEEKSDMKAVLVPRNEANTYWTNEWNKYKSNPSTYYKEVKTILDKLMRPIVARAEYYLY